MALRTSTPSRAYPPPPPSILKQIRNKGAWLFVCLFYTILQVRFIWVQDIPAVSGNSRYMFRRVKVPRKKNSESAPTLFSINLFTKYEVLGLSSPGTLRESTKSLINRQTTTDKELKDVAKFYKKENPLNVGSIKRSLWLISWQRQVLGEEQIFHMFNPFFIIQCMFRSFLCVYVILYSSGQEGGKNSLKLSQYINPKIDSLKPCWVVCKAFLKWKNRLSCD